MFISLISDGVLQISAVIPTLIPRPLTGHLYHVSSPHSSYTPTLIPRKIYNNYCPFSIFSPDRETSVSILLLEIKNCRMTSEFCLPGLSSEIPPKMKHVRFKDASCFQTDDIMCYRNNYLAPTSQEK